MLLELTGFHMEKAFTEREFQKKWHAGIPELWTQELNAGLWTLDSGCWTLDSGRWTLNPGRWTLDPRR